MTSRVIIPRNKLITGRPPEEAATGGPSRTAGSCWAACGFNHLGKRLARSAGNHYPLPLLDLRVGQIDSVARPAQNILRIGFVFCRNDLYSVPAFPLHQNTIDRRDI